MNFIKCSNVVLFFQMITVIDMEEIEEIGVNRQIAVGETNKAHHLNGFRTEVNTCFDSSC